VDLVSGREVLKLGKGGKVPVSGSDSGGRCARSGHGLEGLAVIQALALCGLRGMLRRLGTMYDMEAAGIYHLSLCQPKANTVRPRKF
jgi:hypothetical protein